MSEDSLTLARAQLASRYKISKLDGVASGMAGIDQRLHELGFFVGERVELLRRASWHGGAVLARVGGSTFALRHEEAMAVCLEPLPSQTSPKVTS